MTSIERHQENKEISMSITSLYRRNGVLLTMEQNEALFLIHRGLGTYDKVGDYGHLVGVFIPPAKIDRYFAPAMLRLPGGVLIDRTRDHRDSIIGVQKPSEPEIFDAP